MAKKIVMRTIPKMFNKHLFVSASCNKKESSQNICFEKFFLHKENIFSVLHNFTFLRFFLWSLFWDVGFENKFENIVYILINETSLRIKWLIIINVVIDLLNSNHNSEPMLYSL